MTIICFDLPNRICYLFAKVMDANAMPQKKRLHQFIGTLALFFLATLLFAMCDVAIAPKRLSAHPHAFIVQRLSVRFDKKGMAGIRVRWKFDEMFSNLLVEEHDNNRNGSLEADEITRLKHNAFDPIAQQNYFTFIKIDGRPFDVKFVADFVATLANQRLTYEFTVPCHVSAAVHPKKITIGCYDPSYYTAIFFARKAPVTLVGGDTFDIKTAIREDSDTAIYFNLIHPWALFLSFRTKE